MKAQEIRELSIDDLKAKCTDMSEELNKLRFQHGIRPLENTSSLKNLKRDISRLKTVITEKLKQS